MASSRYLSAAWIGAALALGLAAPAHASDLDLFGADTVSLSADARLIAADGETSWVNGGFGKLRYGDRLGPRLGNADLVWQPRLGWRIGATIVGSVNGGSRAEAGLSEAFLSIRSSPGGTVRWSARAGLMWVPLSTEHEGADWHVADTVTPSAINSWVGEEVRPLAIEGRVDLDAGQHRLALTGGLFAANDTAGTLLALRGWALHDRKTLAGRRQPLPALNEELEYIQPRFTHPLLDVAPGFARRPGYYAKLAWAPPLPLRIELFRYDNRAPPEVANADLEWGWRTAFNHVAAIVQAGPATSLKAQAIGGRTRMGYSEEGRHWVDTRFRSAFLLASHRVGGNTVSGRIEAFGTRQNGSYVVGDDEERGWATTIAAKRSFGLHFTGLAEWVHVDSRREARVRLAEAPRQRQDQIQFVLRARW